jgi:DNA repair protein RecO (recombination protein O)
MMSGHYAALDIRMANHRVLLQPSYLLHQRAYRDSSALLELFTPEFGRVGVVAKGVKSTKSRWRGVLQPFQPLLVSWNQRGELGTLTAAEPQFRMLSFIPEVITSGFYLNEVLIRLLERQERQVELFERYDATLRGMAMISRQDENKSVRLEILLRQFEMRLLAELGYGLVLDQDVGTGLPLQPDQEYAYQLEHGPVSVTVIDIEKVTDVGVRITGRTLQAMQADDFSNEAVRHESKRLLRTVLGHYLGPKPLQSRHLVQSMSRHR